MERAAVASVRLDRCVRRECATLAELVAGAGDEWDRSRRDAAHRAAADLMAAPAASVAALNRTTAGLDWLIARWQGVEAQVRRDGALPLANLLYVLRLLGTAKPPLASDGNAASAFWGMGLGAMEEMLLEPNEAYYGLVPDEGATIEERAEAVHALVPDEVIGPDGLLACITAELERVRARRAEVWEHTDGPLRTAVLDRTRFDASPEAALMRRYETSATSDLHRALNQFLKVRREGFETESEEEPDGTGDLSTDLGAGEGAPGDNPAVAPGIILVVPDGDTGSIDLSQGKSNPSDWLADPLLSPATSPPTQDHEDVSLPSDWAWPDQNPAPAQDEPTAAPTHPQDEPNDHPQTLYDERLLALARANFVQGPHAVFLLLLFVMSLVACGPKRLEATFVGRAGYALLTPPKSSGDAHRSRCDGPVAMRPIAGWEMAAALAQDEPIDNAQAPTRFNLPPGGTGDFSASVGVRDKALVDKPPVPPRMATGDILPA